MSEKHLHTNISLAVVQLPASLYALSAPGNDLRGPMWQRLCHSTNAMLMQVPTVIA